MIKKILPAFIIIVFIISCKDNIKITTGSSKNDTVAKAKEPAMDFEGFKSALINWDTTQVKSYIKFPLKTDTYIAWHYKPERVYEEDGGDISLVESDYENNKYEMFPDAFGETLKNISIDDLIKKRELISPVVTDEEGHQYQSEFLYDKEWKELDIQLTLKNPVQIREANDTSGMEYSKAELEIYRAQPFNNIRYYFEVDKNKNIRLFRVDAYK